MNPLMILHTVLWLHIMAHMCDGYGSGAPTSACTHLTPGHYGWQGSPSPFNISVSATDFKPGETVTVSVTPGYQGILLQARLADGSTIPVGKFISSPDNTRIFSCSSSNDAVTHSNTQIKTGTGYVWMSPSEDIGPVIFVATIARGQYEYWVMVESQVLPVRSLATTRRTTTRRVTTTTRAPTTSKPSTAAPTSTMPSSVPSSSVNPSGQPSSSSANPSGQPSSSSANPSGQPSSSSANPSGQPSSSSTANSGSSSTSIPPSPDPSASSPLQVSIILVIISVCFTYLA